MKRTFMLVMVLFFSFVGLSQEVQFAKFEADIANSTGSIYMSFNEKVIKKMEKNSDGIYKDTINALQGNYKLFDGKNYIQVFLNNETDLKLKMDANDVDNTIVFSGAGSEVNNFITQSRIAVKKIDFMELFALEESVFLEKAAAIKQLDLERLDKYVKNPEIKATIQKGLDVQYESLPGIYKKYKEQAELAKTQLAQQNAETDKMNNVVSPIFNYQNYKGGKTALDGFKGKYVYIDVWATWCGPCRGEIPYLKKMEEEFHDKNIVFVSISVDALKDLEKWKTFVKDNNLGGVQLFADNSFDSHFISSFGINSIPRFILIDPIGKVVKANATRPSNPSFKEELKALLN